MKRLLALLLILALAGVVSATSLNFQNPGDNTSVVLYSNLPGGGSSYYGWSESTVGGNSYMTIGVTSGGSGAHSDYVGITLPRAYPMTYAAATYMQGSGTGQGPGIALLDANRNLMYGINLGNNGQPTTRIEVKMDGGIARVYKNGVLFASSGTLAQTPSYIVFGIGRTIWSSYGFTVNWDDVVWAEPNTLVMSLPESDNNAFVIMKDVINPAASGLWNTTSNTQANANYMTGTWSRGNGTIGADVAQPNESIEFRYLGTDQVYATNWTGTGYTGTMAWNIKTMLIDAGAPQGTYGLYRPKTGEYGDSILFKSNGAQVSWNADEYSVGDTGTALYYILDGGYWDTSLFSYKLCVLDSYYQFIQNTSLTASSGSVTYDWTEDNAEGVYHAWLIATNHDGYEYILGSDYAELVAFFGYGGYVNDGYTTLPISGANVNVSQGMTAIYNGTSGFNGNYSTGPLFGTGGSVFFNVTKYGYNPYQYSFVPLSSGSTYDLNLTIYPSAGSGEAGGLGIGGVIRDATIGRPIQGATVYLTNVSNSQQYSKTTNMAGGYICDLGTTCSLVSGRVYAVNASKISYNTSVDYQVTV